MRKLLAVPMSAAALAAALAGWPAGSAHAQDGARLAAQLCAACHGAHGRSESPMFPRLNAQTKEYLSAQLKGFREHARGETDARAYMHVNGRRARFISESAASAEGESEGGRRLS